MPRDIYRAEMGVPPMPDEGAPGPISQKARLSIGKASDLSAAERERFSRMPMEPVSGEEVGMEEKKAKVYKKRFASGGSASSRADGCAKRGKTRGTMVVMSKGGYKK